MRTPSGTNSEPPTTHTAVIGCVADMWAKLAWDVHAFSLIQRSHPQNPVPLGFAAINVCIAASSLFDWTLADTKRRLRATKKPFDETKFREVVFGYVQPQPMCEAIANTAKHSRFNPGAWTDGRVEIRVREANDDDPGGYVLYHVHENTIDSIALNAFEVLEQCWWGALQSLGYSFPAHRPWLQEHLRKILGVRGEQSAS